VSGSPRGVKPSAAASYWDASRAPRYSLIFALPLFLLYEGLAAALSGSAGMASVRNAADLVLKTPFLMFSGARGSMAFFATVIGVCVFLVGRDLKKANARLQPRTFALMLGESALLGLLLGAVVGLLTQRLVGALSLSLQSGVTGLEGMSVGTRLMLALGAGLYEELLFRVLLVGGLAAGLQWMLGGKRWVSGVIAAVIGAVVFSAFHYLSRDRGTCVQRFVSRPRLRHHRLDPCAV
jgi:hypothetical protein